MFASSTAFANDDAAFPNSDLTMTGSEPAASILVRGIVEETL